MRGRGIRYVQPGVVLADPGAVDRPPFLDVAAPLAPPLGTMVDVELVDEFFPVDFCSKLPLTSEAFGVSEDRRDWSAPKAGYPEVSESRKAFAWAVGDLREMSAKPRHFRQPSKSIRACMQPHSVTFCSSHTMFTGWDLEVSIYC